MEFEEINKVLGDFILDSDKETQAIKLSSCNQQDSKTRMARRFLRGML